MWSLLLPGSLDLDNSAATCVYLGLHIHKNGQLLPVIKFMSTLGDRISMDENSWTDFQKHFSTIAAYLQGREEEEDITNSHNISTFHTTIIGAHYILQYGQYYNQPAVVIQSSIKNDRNSAQRLKPSLFRFVKSHFIKLTMLLTPINNYLSWLCRVCSEVEACKALLITTIASKVSNFTTRCVRRDIRTKRKNIRETVSRKVKMSGPLCELSAYAKAAVINELMTRHQDHIVKNVIALGPCTKK